MTAYQRSTALIVVDVQNDFADPRGSLYVNGGGEVVAFGNGQIDRALAGGALIVYTQDWHPETTPHFTAQGGPWPVHCVHDTWGATLHPDLRVAGLLVKKGVNGEDGYSGFTVRDPITGATTPTELPDLLREHGIVEVVVIGLATDYCVRETAVDAVRLGWATTVLSEGVRTVDVNPGDGDRALRGMHEAGVRITTTI